MPNKNKKNFRILIFFFCFFLLYFLLQYFLLYHSNGLSPFQINIHFFSNCIASISKRYLLEVIPFVFVFYILYFTKKTWKRILLVLIFDFLWIINTLMMVYYYISKVNFKLYIIEAFSWKLFNTFLNPVLFTIVILYIFIFLALNIALFKIKSKKTIKKKQKYHIIFLFILLIFINFIKIDYDNNISLYGIDNIEKKNNKIQELDQSSINLFFQELKFKYFHKKGRKEILSEEDKNYIKNKELNNKKSQNFKSPAKKIILIVVESLDQDFISYYNKEIPENTSPFIDSLIRENSHIDNFYPSGPYTIFGVSDMLCGHTNLKQIERNNAHVCIPKILSENNFFTKFIRGFSKYYIGENIYFKKYGFKKIHAKEEFLKEFPEFKEEHKDLYDGWGYTDNYVFDEAIKTLKTSKKDDKLFLTLLTVDTHTPGGRCYWDDLDYSKDNPILYSIHCADKYLSNFMSQIKENNLLDDDTVIFITSDQLYPNYNKTKGYQFKTSFKQEPAKIPLIMISKNNKWQFKADIGSHIDLASTILDITNKKEPEYYIGKSLLSNTKSNPVGEDGPMAYIILNNKFNSFNLNNSVKNLTKKEKVNNFVLDINANNNLNAILDNKIQNINMDFSSNISLFKWYINKYYNLTNTEY